MIDICGACGKLIGVDEYDAKLWEMYYRRRDGRQYTEGLVFDGTWIAENVIDEEDANILELTMEKDMVARGLCPKCGLPNLDGLVYPDDFMDQEEAREIAEIESERRAEMRMGC